MPIRFRRRIENVEGKVDGVLSAKVLPVVESIKSADKIDIGNGVIVPTRDAIRGLQLLHETREGLLGTIVKIMTIVNCILTIVVLVKVFQ